MAIWLVYAVWNFGTIIPNPALIKSDATFPSSVDILYGLQRTIMILLGGNGIEIIGILVCTVVMLFQTNHPTINARFILLVLIWATFPAFTYLSRGVFVQSRYLLIGIPPLIIGGFLSFKWLLSLWNEIAMRRVLYVIASLLLIQQAAMTYWVTMPHVAAFKPTVSALVQIASRINREAPSDALVAVGDVGIVGFYCGRRVLDLEGLVSSEIIPYRVGMSLDQFILSGSFLKAGSPNYLIDKAKDPRRLENKWNAELIEIYPIPGGLIESADQKWYYTLYRLNP
jgi:hypothetical protein